MGTGMSPSRGLPPSALTTSQRDQCRCYPRSHLRSLACREGQVPAQGHKQGPLKLELPHSSTGLRSHHRAEDLAKSGRTSSSEDALKEARGQDQETLASCRLPLLLESHPAIHLISFSLPNPPLLSTRDDFPSLCVCFRPRCEELACDVWISAQQHNPRLPESQDVFRASSLRTVGEPSQ